MGLLNGKLMHYLNMSETEIREPYDENSNNGLIINNKYIPEELLSQLFSYVDYKSLVICQLVCKRWNLLIQNYIWRKKAEVSVNHNLPVDKNAPWTMYYSICDKKPFYKNLIKNHSGQYSKSNWKIINTGGDGWTIECPPIGVPPLPTDPVFEEKNYCFVTSYMNCLKVQLINLLDEGFTEYLLDNMQPTIKVSEWYSCRFDCAAIYSCSVQLLGKENESDKQIVLNSINFSKILKNEEQNIWMKFNHEFKNYGKGLRFIRFSHAGKDQSFWSGHYGSKMAGACVKIEIPSFSQSLDLEMFD